MQPDLNRLFLNEAMRQGMTQPQIQQQQPGILGQMANPGGMPVGGLLPMALSQLGGGGGFKGAAQALSPIAMIAGLFD